MKGTIQAWNENKNNDNYSIELEGGIELRDYFAGQAITLFGGSYFASKTDIDSRKPNYDALADYCYNLADAMLKRREKK